MSTCMLVKESALILDVETVMVQAYVEDCGQGLIQRVREGCHYTWCSCLMERGISRGLVWVRGGPTEPYFGETNWALFRGGPGSTLHSSHREVPTQHITLYRTSGAPQPDWAQGTQRGREPGGGGGAYTPFSLSFSKR